MPRLAEAGPAHSHARQDERTVTPPAGDQEGPQRFGHNDRRNKLQIRVTLAHMNVESAGRTVLICDDERIVALAERSVLERAGYTVSIATSGEQTLKMLADGRQPDLILMDIDLGEGMDGTAAAGQIIERYDIPVVFLSAHTEPDIVERTEGITSYGYVVKHSGETVLLASIRMAFRLFETRQKQHEAEEQLRMQNRYLELYRTAVDSMEDHKVALVDSSYTYRMVSRQFRESYQMSESQIVGYTVADLVGANVFESKIRPFISRALEGQSLEFRDWFSLPAIGSRYMRVRYYPLPNFDVTDRAVAVVIQDITEKAQAERQARVAEHNLDLIFNAVPAVIWVTDRQGRYIRVNRAWSQLSGIAPDDAVGRTAFDVFTSDMARKLGEEEREIVRTGNPILGQLQAYRTLSGVQGWSRTDRLPMPDESGATIGVVGFAVDVTAEQNALEDLRMEEARSRAILSALPDIVFVTDRYGTILEYHTRAHELLAATNIEEKDIGVALPRETADFIRGAIQAANDSGELQVIEYALHVPAGLRYFEDRLVPMDDEKVLGVVRDVTRRKEAEHEVQRQITEKENLLREVQHRIKNTMHTMGSVLSMHADSLSDSPVAADALRDARSRFGSMEVLYDQLYRNETHNEGSLEAYLNHIVETVVALFPDGSWVHAHVDTVDRSLNTRVLSALGMIVTELVTNAMKHAFSDRDGEDSERPLLQITGSISEGVLKIEVADNGNNPSFDEQAMSQNSFGIRMVHSLTEQLGGTITFTRAGGTRAVLEFPL